MKKEQNNNKLLKLVKTKKFKESLEVSLFQTRISGIILKSRNEMGISQSALAKKVGTTQRIISDIENGDYKMAEMLYRLLRVLNKPLVCDGVDLIMGQKIKHSNSKTDVISLKEAGRYSFEIKLKAEKDKDYSVVATLPLDVKFVEAT